MLKAKGTRSGDSEKLDQLLETAQLSFILQALQAGLNTDAIRSLLGIDYLRVIEVSKHFKKAQNKSSPKPKR